MAQRLACEWESPIGTLRLVSNGSALVAIEFADDPRLDADRDSSEGVLKHGVRQLVEYFAGKRTEFDIPLEPEGTSFQRQVWTTISRVPFGETTSYGEIALRLKRPMSSRAVGAANGKNPIPIIVPCHRIIGGDGSLTGYRGGLSMKRWLLAHEAKHCRQLAVRS